MRGPFPPDREPAAGHTPYPRGVGFRAYQAAPPLPEPEPEPEVQSPGGHPRLRQAVRIATVLLALLMLLVAWLALTAPLSKSLEPIATPQITLLASNGTPIARKGANIEAQVRVKALPAHVPHAFLAIEDRRFYSHWGIDPIGIGRAVWTNLTTGRTQGGSTITQQLAKFTFLTPERSLTRKAREALIAFWLEIWLTKDEILERYLSNAYFGDNTYGLRAASLHYFHRQPERLTVEQAAMLAGLVQAPSRLAPSKNYKAAERRMKMVLAAMVETKWLTPQAARATRTPRLDIRDASNLPTGTYFADWAIPQVQEESGYARRTVTTTLDAQLQAAARAAVNGAGLASSGLGKAQVALVAMRPTGEVVAMIGGRDYARSPFNRATQARRQPGSTFKLFVYLAALKDGWRPDDTIANTPFTAGSYRPKNYGERYSPTISLAQAFAQSSNVAAVRLYGKVGSDKVIDTARDFGISAPLPKGDPSVALGTSGTTLLEMTAAYAAVAANAHPIEPRAFKAAEQGWFARLWDGPSALPGSVHRDIEAMLARAVSSGTGRAAALPIAVHGKTGTSQDARDALFIGYAGDLVVGVWVGNDDNTPIAGMTGGGVPARIWRDFMSRALGVAARPKPRPTVNPSGPVEPLDVPDVGDIPVSETTRIRIEDGKAVVTTEIGGRPVELPIDLDGIGNAIPSGARIDQQVERARDLTDADYRAIRARQEAEEQAARARAEARRAAQSASGVAPGGPR